MDCLILAVFEYKIYIIFYLRFVKRSGASAGTDKQYGRAFDSSIHRLYLVCVQVGIPTNEQMSVAKKRRWICDAHARLESLCQIPAVAKFPGSHLTAYLSTFSWKKMRGAASGNECTATWIDCWVDLTEVDIDTKIQKPCKSL
jgi:hypothetical protein